MLRFAYQHKKSSDVYFLHVCVVTIYCAIERNARDVRTSEGRSSLTYIIWETASGSPSLSITLLFSYVSLCWNVSVAAEDPLSESRAYQV